MDLSPAGTSTAAHSRPSAGVIAVADAAVAVPFAAVYDRPSVASAPTALGSVD